MISSVAFGSLEVIGPAYREVVGQEPGGVGGGQSYKTIHSSSCLTGSTAEGVAKSTLLGALSPDSFINHSCSRVKTGVEEWLIELK